MLSCICSKGEECLFVVVVVGVVEEATQVFWDG